MKNKFKFFLYFCVVFLITFTKAQSNDLEFEAKNINTISDDIVIATDDVIITDSLGNKIFADQLEIDYNKKIYTIFDNVVYKDLINLITIKSNKIIFDQNKNNLLSVGSTQINKKNEYSIKSNDIFFDKDKNFISSNNESQIVDMNENKINVEKFEIYLNKNQFIGVNSTLIDKTLNSYFIKKLFYDFKEQKIYGKDININHNNDSLSSKRHLPRAKSRTLIIENDNLFLNKSVYTNCKKRDGCPPWLIEAEEINHDKKNKIVNYKNATLKFYDVPVLYFPKFFHPDPTVKRQSGFLTPKFSAQNNNSYLNLPYFVAISKNSDFTFSPRFYDNSKNLYQGEYRHITKNTEHIFDLSIKNDNPLLLKSNSTDSHFFYKSLIKTEFDLFDFSQFDIQFQSVSDEKYLKSYNLYSPIIDSQSSLKSTINFTGYTDDLEFLLSSEVYEDLTKTKESDRYEFVTPNFNLTKKLSFDLDGLLELNSLGYNKLYNTNISEKVLVNNLSYKSLNKINKMGFVNNYEFTLKNFNADSKHSSKFKNKNENNLQGLFQFNSKIPMKKYGDKFNSTLTPIFVAKFNPYQNKNISSEDRIVDYANIYSINRLSSNEILEGGESITLGNEFKILSKNDSEIFSLNLATSLRDKENKDLPKNSYLGKKSSNIAGESNLKINEFVDLNYNFLADNNLGSFNYHKLKSNFKINNFVTSFEFIEENNDIGNDSFISNETSYAFDENKNLLFRTRKNKKTNLTEYYDLIYQYKMDCLTAGIEYRKTYYSDGALEPKESLFFSFTIMPFNNKVDLPGIN
jgi:LPS-assembly protein